MEDLIGLNDLERWILSHEGLKLFPYKDTVGKTSIGIGRNLSDCGISKEEAIIFLRNDIDKCKKDLEKFSWYMMQPTGVKDALINMCFNLGLTRLMQFKNMIACLEKKDYVGAAREVLNSKYAKDVGKRANDIAVHISEGR